MEALESLLQRLTNWQSGGYVSTVDVAAKTLAKTVSNDIASGINPSGVSYVPLKESTLNAPVRISEGGPRRSSYGVTPLRATGHLSSSIVADKKSDREWEVGADNDKANAILVSNAYPSKSGKPFIGETPKPGRDALALSGRYVDIIADKIAEDLERVII